MLFSNITGKNNLKDQVLTLFNSNRVPHALLFNGNEGSGAFQLALSLAQLLLCANPLESDSCGECSSCIKVQKIMHPDLHFSFPIQLSQTNKVTSSDDLLDVFIEMVIEFPFFSIEQWADRMGNKNKQGIIGTKESQQIIKKLSLKSYEGGAKVLLMWLPEEMNQQGANKLLKLIEEPPEKTYFLFVSEKKEQLLPTIQSRLQIIDVPDFSEQEIIKCLKEKYNASSEKASLVSSISFGNMSKAVQCFDSENPNDIHLSSFITWMRLCYTRNIADTIDWVDTTSKEGREQIKGLLLYTLEMFRKCILGHYAVKINGITKEQERFLKKFSPFINHKNIVQFSEVINNAHFHMERNANPKILMLDVSILFFRLLKTDKK
jgi:DNA polymerase III subunit delta'